MEINVSKSRRMDGKPETPADKRFFDERASGYTGPLDQDGRRVTDPKTLGIFDSLAKADAEREYRQARAVADAKRDKAAEAIRQMKGGNAVRQAHLAAADAQRALDYRAAGDEYKRS
jgi:hypothetical protein